MFSELGILSNTQVYCYLRNLLPSILCGIEKFDSSNLKPLVYASWHLRNTQHIDQGFYGCWDALMHREKQEKSLCRAAASLPAEYFFDNNDRRRLAIRKDRYSKWQNWLANQSALPVIAYRASEILPPNNSQQRRLDWLFQQLSYRSLISPYDKRIEDYIHREGLNEVHLHLNGTSTVEHLWLFALRYPRRICQDLMQQYRNPRVKLWYAANPTLNHPKEYESLLNLASKLRALLVAWCNNHPQFNAYVHAMIRDLGGCITSDHEYPLPTICRPSSTFEKHHIAELDLHIKMLIKLGKDPSPRMDACYLLYLTCLGGFQRILVQRDDQFGFDQFQKIADAGMREAFELDYRSRFFQLRGQYPLQSSDLCTLEARFAPKGSLEKNESLIRSVLRGFLQCEKGGHGASNLTDLNMLALEVKKKH